MVVSRFLPRSVLFLRLGHSLKDIAESFLLHLLDGSADVDGDNILFVGQGALKNIELAVNHVGAHVVVLSLGDTSEKKLLRGVKKDEVDLDTVIVVSSHSDNVAVLALEGRASKDDTI